MTGEGDERVEGEMPEIWTDDQTESLETEQLDLAQDGERLPWLESPDDDDYASEGTSEAGRYLGLAALATVAAAAIVGGVWWVSHRTSVPSLAADGSVIAAPKEPYKEAPRNPGGKTFDGTGDSSFAVSEGQNRPARLSDGKGSASPVALIIPPKAGAKPAAAPAANSNAIGVQVGAFSSQSTAESGWAKLVGQAGTTLSGVSHRVVAGKADIGTVYRLQAVVHDAAAAAALCTKLKAAGISCQVK